MGIKLSVIVPIYKVEKYLRKCVDSILHQDLLPDEYEIILVDDGSPDGCGAIADEYASQYSNIHVIHQKNGGLSAARNTGLGAAVGEYVQFVDSDDYLEQDVLGSLIRKMDSDCLDVLRYDYQNVNEKYEVYQPYKEVKPFVDLKDEICDGLTFLNERLGYACYAWQFVIRTSLLKNASLFFKEGILFEDTEWTPRMLICANKVSSTDCVVYNYLTRIGSITKADSEKKWQRVIDNQFDLLDSLKDQSGTIDVNRWFLGMIARIAISILSEISCYYFSNRRLYINQLKRKKIFPLSDYHIGHAALKRDLINISPNLFCMLYHITHVK